MLWNSYWNKFRDVYGLNGLPHVGVLIYGTNGQKTQVNYSQKKMKAGGLYGILDLNDPTNPYSALTFRTASNELDAFSGVVSIWFENPLNKMYNKGPYDPIPFYMPSTTYPGYYDSPVDGDISGQYVYKYVYDGGIHQMFKIKTSTLTPK